MNRRSLLKLLPVAVVGAALGSNPHRATSNVIDVSEGIIGGHSYLASHREELRNVTRKIIKDSAHLWGVDTRYRKSERGAVLVTLYGNLARKITFDSGYIIEKEITLNEKQRTELQQYQDSRHRYVPQRIGAKLANSGWRLRAWVYNGRRPNEWIMSAEKAASN